MQTLGDIFSAVQSGFTVITDVGYCDPLPPICRACNRPYEPQVQKFTKWQQDLYKDRDPADIPKESVRHVQACFCMSASRPSGCGGYKDLTAPGIPELMESLREANNTLALNSIPCTCERTRAEEEDRLWKDSGLDPTKDRKTFSNLETRKSEVLANVFDKALSFVSKPVPPIWTLVGPTGTGKSHIMEAMVRLALQRSIKARYVTVASLLNQLRATNASSSERTLHSAMEWYKSIRFLALDDLGMGGTTDFGQQALTDIVEYRIQHELATVISSNLFREDVAPLYGERLADRLYPENRNSHDAQLTILAHRQGEEPLESYR